MASPYANWSSTAYYNVGDIVQYLGFYYKAVLANIGVTPSASSPWSVFTPPLAPLPAGIHSVTASTTQTISIPGLTTNGVVNLTYIHPPSGGAAQYFKGYTPTTDTLTVLLGQIGTVGESIIWSVAQF
jgi:hypothetical protein